MPLRLRGAAVLVTGASSGIGEATAMAFARRGARLALCARRLDRLQAVADRCRSAGAEEVVVRRADVGRRVEARGFVAAALRDFERVDVLVNNAGIGWMGRLGEMPEEEVDRLLDVNLKGVVWCTQAVLPGMLAARRGVIVNVASVVAFRASPYAAVYSASKHAVAGLSHALRGELSGTGVKVCTVYPSVTDTEFFSAGKTMAPLGPAYPASWVAGTIVRTARWPRRDAMVLPIRALQVGEPLFGGLMDHVLGELRRMQSPALGSGEETAEQPPL